MADDPDQIFDLNEKPADELAHEIDPSENADMHVDPLAPAEPGLEAVVRQWRVAKALEHFRSQVNRAFPGRSKASDGTIGDAAHASRSSDHNPWVVDNGIGVVTACDLTHDPNGGCDAGHVAEAIRASRDTRVKYIIWNRRIANSSTIGGAPAWTWRVYSGTNPHNHHCHLSVRADKASYDDVRDWNFRGGPESVEETVSTDLETNWSASLEALAGEAGEPLLQRLVNAQDEIAALLSVYAAQTRVLATDTEQAARPSFDELKPQYESLWRGCVIRPEHSSEVAWYRGKLLRNKARYDDISAATGAPWWFVGIVHALEASFNFQAHLHNGDPLSARTVQEPKGRPIVWNPPTDWRSSAIDAITGEGFANQSDWSLARALFRLEGYNGYSYHTKGINSPYIWSFSNQYTKGKFIRDHVYDPNTVSKQCGAAVMLKALAALGDVRI